ncbi:uncharacterized protein PAC_18688 [Phialocephala subalpina]|uniref:Uncharacterized protein n=1 Tax=Phialocephala subalpina TaxID=576137 RepID=A0A1L7XUT3_9HELO|nr:uncharacterized protein PAC_18688 [Phialocephala subalpina]
MDSTSIKLASFSKEFKTLSSSISTLSRSSRELQEENNWHFQLALENTMSSIMCTWDTLKELSPVPAISDSDENDDSFLFEDEDEESEMMLEMLQEDVVELSQRVDVLTTQTGKGLAASASLKQQSAELAQKAQRLNLQIKNTREEVESQLDAKNDAYSRAVDVHNERVDECNKAISELNELEEKLEDKRDDRALLRVGRVAMWGTSLFLPGMAVVAAGMEIAAKKLRDNIADKKSRKRACESAVNSARSSVESLRTQATDLHRTAECARTLMDDCVDKVDESDSAVTKTENMEKSFQAIDSAANKLVVTVRELQVKTTVMKDLGVARLMLQGAVEEFVNQLSKGGQKELVGSLERMRHFLN